MDGQNLKPSGARGAKMALVFSVIFSIISALAFSFYVVFFVGFVEAKLSQMSGANDLGVGFGVAFGLAFSLIFGILAAALSMLGGGASVLGVRLAEGRARIVAKVLLVTNILFFALVGISLIVGFIVA